MARTRKPKRRKGDVFNAMLLQLARRRPVAAPDGEAAPDAAADPARGVGDAD